VTSKITSPEEETEHMEDCITIQGGTIIEDCQKKLAKFCRDDASYEGYDKKKVNEDNWLTKEDIQLANFMGARMGPSVIQSVVDRTKTINLALEHVPAGLELSDNGVPWVALENLFRAALGPHIRAARATKILHKKRPHLIPILDSVVVSYCQSVNRHSDRDEASMMVECVRTIKTDIERNLDTFRRLIATTNLKITAVRAHDILVWAYSGEYQNKFGIPPLWQR